MEYLKNSNQEAANEFSLYQNSQKIIKFLLSVSLFSVLFSSLPLLLHSFNAFLMKICGYSILKNCMFLLCNGLVVFIVKNSGLMQGSSSSTTYQTEEIAEKNIGGTGKSESKELEITEPVAGERIEEIEFQGEAEKSLITEEQKDESLNSEEKGEVEGVEGKEIVIIDEDLPDVEETEELNKKCEDFIRKMKAAFCSEPRTCNYSYEFDHQRAIMAL